MSEQSAMKKSSSQLDNNDGATTAEDNECDNECVVCFKNVDIYSIGECDHPVCYECSTRMRVLCQRNECPICRAVLSKVIFTHKKLSYRELEAKNRSEYYSKKYQVSFCTNAIQQAFFDLLAHPCPKCSTAPYRTFPGLKNHVRKEHDLHYCDLCTDNLKIFTFERRCYTQAEMGLHRTKGDADNRSHRGHPLCEYCNTRYLDRDELFRHLRRDHYFCHFCDADGCNSFYKDYNALAEHFRQDHYLCEEGKCASEEFVGAFRTEIDYKAHMASVHGNLLNKQQAKQTRTLQLEITLGPRGGSGRAGGGQQGEQTGASMRSRGSGVGGGGGGGVGCEEAAMYDDSADRQNTQLLYAHHSGQQRMTIDACNEQDFPSLRGAGGGGPSLSLTRPPPLSMRNRSATAGLARTKENFPALAGVGAAAVQTTWSAAGSQRSNAQQVPISAVLRKAPTAATGAISRTATSASGGSVSVGGHTPVIHVSNRPATAQPAKKSSSMEFPALVTSKSKKMPQRNFVDDDLDMAPPSPAHSSALTNTAAKHRTLIDDYVSVANPQNFHKLQTIQKEELEAIRRKTNEAANAPKLTTYDFPSLSGSESKPAASSSWTKGGPSMAAIDKKQREAENRKSKVAPAPLIPTKESRINGNNNNNNNNSIIEQQQQATKKKGKEKTAVAVAGNVKPNTNNKAPKEKNNNNNNNENKTSNANLLMNGSAGPPIRPPPGFSGSSVKPPPGFQLPGGNSVTLNSVAKSPNNLTFTNSLGESYSIVKTHAYVPPTEAITRNQKLVGHFKDVLKTPEALDEFRHISLKFREGVYKPLAYYEHCQAALRDKFDQVFPELLVLLPDIKKQQALYLVHTQTLSPLQRQRLAKLTVCATCKQVLLTSDLDSHRKLHEMSANFPALDAAGARK